MTVSDVKLDPYDYDFHEDPYPYYQRLRDEAPLYRNEELGFWALSRHQDVLQGFRNSTTLSNKFGVSLDPASRGPHASKTMSFLAMDDPDHLRLRTLVSKGFTPRRIRELEPRVTEIATRHLDAMLEKVRSSDTAGTKASTSSSAGIRKRVPSFLRTPLKTTQRAGILTPMAKLSVARSTCTSGVGGVEGQAEGQGGLGRGWR